MYRGKYNELDYVQRKVYNELDYVQRKVYNELDYVQRKKKFSILRGFLSRIYIHTFMILDLKSYYLFRGKYVTFYTWKNRVTFMFRGFSLNKNFT